MTTLITKKMKREESPTCLLQVPKCTGLCYHLRGGVPLRGLWPQHERLFLVWNVCVPDRVSLSMCDVEKKMISVLGQNTTR